MPRCLIRAQLCRMAMLVVMAAAVWAVNAASPPHASGHLLVKFKATEAGRVVRGLKAPQARAHLLDQLALPAGARLEEPAFAAWKRHRTRQRGLPAAALDLDYFLYLRLPPGLTVDQCLRHLRHHPLVEYVEPDGIGTGGTIPNDPDFDLQWHHLNFANAGADIRTPEAWDLTTGSTNVILAVLDTGLNLSLTEFTNRLVPGMDFVNTDDDPSDDQGHGTAVTGVAAANADNGLLVAGVDWQCRIMPVKVLDENNSGFYSWWAQGLDYAVANGAKVVNLSAGGGSSSTTLTTSIDNAIAAGVLFVTITHNDNRDTIRYPGNLTQAITVGATDIQDERVDTPSWGSNWGPEIDLVAPGLSIRTVNRFGNLGTWSGTSFAAPQVAGVCALLASLNPQITQAEAETLLTTYADDLVGDSFDTPGFDPYYGHGRLNAFRTLLATGTNVAQIALTQNVWPNPVVAGCALTAFLELENLGPAPATGVTIDFTFPSEVELLAVTASQGTESLEGDTLTLSLGELAVDTVATIRIDLRPQTVGFLALQSEAGLNEMDPRSEDNTALDLVEVLADSEPPELLSAIAGPDGSSVEVTFSRAVDPVMAADPGQYVIHDAHSNTVAVSRVEATRDPAVLRLEAPFTGGLQPLQLVVLQVTDCLGQVAETPQTISILVPTQLLVGAGSTWRYKDDGVDPGPDWTSAGFDDSGWSVGVAELGYGDGDEATEIGFGDDEQNKHVTTWFRRPFEILNPNAWTNVQLELLRDDGAAVFLNGLEIFRSNLPDGTLLPSTLALTSVGSGNESNFFAAAVSPSALVPGTNWLAVEVHQAAPDSSDLSFDLRLSATLRRLTLPPVFVRHPDSQTVVQGDTVHLKVQVGGTPPFGYRWRHGFLPLTAFGEVGPLLTLTNVQVAQAGSYTAVVTNAANPSPGLLSERAILMVLSDGDGDRMPDAWEQIHGFDPEQPDDGALDADMDGVPNNEEFSTGTDPRDPDSFLKWTRIENRSGGVRLTFLAVSNRTYAVDFKPTTDASPWQWLRDIPSAPTNRMVTVEDSSTGADVRIYRLVTPHQP